MASPPNRSQYRLIFGHPGYVVGEFQQSPTISPLSFPSVTTPRCVDRFPSSATYLSAESMSPHREICLGTSGWTFTAEPPLRLSSNQIDGFDMVMPRAYRPVSHGGRMWPEPYHTIHANPSFPISEIMSCPVRPQASRVIELSPASTSLPHESRVTVVMDDRKYPDGGVPFTEEPQKDVSDAEHAAQLTQPVDYPPSEWVGLQGRDPTDQNGIVYSLRVLEDGLCECTWKDDSGSHCGFVSRINSVKKHTRRVHLRLRLDFRNVFILRPLTDCTSADRISVRSAAADSSLNIRVPFIKTFSECATPFTPTQLVLRQLCSSTGLKPHVCEECGLGFPNPSARTYHRTRHHDAAPPGKWTPGRTNGLEENEGH